MNNIYSNEYDGDIIIIDGTETSRKSITKKHITDMIHGIQLQMGYYNLFGSITIEFDNKDYKVDFTADNYSIKEIKKTKPLPEVDTKPETLMRGQRFKLDISTTYKKLEYIQNEDDIEWYKYSKDTITPIKAGLYNLKVKINGKEFIKPFAVVEQPDFIGDVNNVTSEAWTFVDFSEPINVNIDTQAFIEEPTPVTLPQETINS